MIYSTKDINDAFFGAVATIAPDMDVKTFQEIASRGMDPEEVAKLDPEILIIGAAWLHENLIAMQRERLIDRVIDMTDRLGAARVIGKLNGLDLAAHPDLTEDDRADLTDMLEALK